MTKFLSKREIENILHIEGINFIYPELNEPIIKLLKTGSFMFPARSHTMLLYLISKASCSPTSVLLET